MNLLEAMYKEELEPRATVATNTEEKQEEQSLKELTATFTKEQLVLFNRFLDLHDVYWCSLNEKMYCRGVQAGIRLLVEALDEKY